jgi:hypothetical protein
LEVSTTPSSRSSSRAWPSSANASSGPSPGSVAKAPKRSGCFAISSALPSLIILDRRVPNSGWSADPANVIGMDTIGAAICCRSM